VKVLSQIRLYGLAAISCGLALAVAWPLDAPSSCFFLAVIVSSLYGGRGPGLLAVGLSCLAFDYFFLPPRFHFPIEPSSYLRFGAFFGATLLVATLIGVKQRVEEARRQIAAQVQRSEAYLVAGQRLSHTGSWAFNVASGELFWSQETFRIFGFDPTRTSASLEMFLQRIHPDDRPRIEQGINDAPTEARDYVADYRIVLPDGSIKYIHDVVYTVANPDGRIVERYGVIMDMTEHKLAEEEREHSFDQLRALTARVQSAREEERTRVAREIHDELGQALTAIKIDFSSWVHDLPPEVRRWDKIDSILNLVDQTIKAVRRISTELRPGILDDLGLIAAIEWAAEEFEARTGTQCRLRLSDFDAPIDQQRDTALFRVFQETLTNVARHADATCVDINLFREMGSIVLKIQDNGCGATPEQLFASTSLGIRGMKERALLLGGDLVIRSSREEGTTVLIRVPEG
jgi:signal transduction histidine kinase